MPKEMLMEEYTWNVAVLDYRNGSVMVGAVKLPKDATVDDLEEYLIEHTNYSSDECYFLTSGSSPISIRSLEVKQ